MKIKRKSIIEFIVVAVVFTGSMIYFNNWENKFEKRLMEEGKFAIGTFTKHEYPSGRGSSYKYRYTFFDEFGQKHYQGDSQNLPKGNFRLSVFVGDRFLVIYNEDGSNIYFDRPIRDSTDFVKYIKEFEEARKKQSE